MYINIYIWRCPINLDLTVSPRTKFKMRPGGSPSGSAWKSVDLCRFRLGTKNAKPVQSVGIQKQLGPEDVFGLACFDPNSSRPEIWLSARAYTFCYMCLACYHTTTNLNFFFTVSATRLNFFFTVSLPKLNFFFTVSIPNI
jgi:hypothetical protein